MTTTQDSTARRVPLRSREVRGVLHLTRSPVSARLARKWLAVELVIAPPVMPVKRIGHAMLIVSELVTNVLVHTDSAPIVRCGEPGGVIVVEVYDHRHGDHPRLLPADPERGTGNGMRIVDSLADRWGTTTLGDGRKFVWFEIHGDPVSAPRD